MILAFLFYKTTNIFMMYIMCGMELELLRKIDSNDGQPQGNDNYEKVVAKRLLRGL
jgi:hypothetical protein